jgi:hypothetical protein
MKDLIINSNANKADYYLISKLPIVVKNEILDTACKETAAFIQGFISK